MSGAPDVTLVTGAAGFFGGNLARALCERGLHVRVLVRRRRPVALEGLDYEAVEGDLNDPGSLARAVTGCRRVYHAAASVTFWCRTRSQYDAVRRVNVDGTRCLMQAAASAGVERVVHVSTVDAIGLPPPGAIADEDTNWPPGRIDNIYAATKREAEAVAFGARVDTVVVSPAFMLGSFDPKPTSGRLLLPVLRSPLVVCPARGGNNFVHVRDVVAGTMAAMEKGRSRERYVLGGENLTYREFFGRAIRLAGVRRWLIPLSRPVAILAGATLERAAWISRLEPPLTASMARIAFADHYYDSSKAIRELGLPHTPVDRAIAEALDWLRGQRRHASTGTPRT